MLVVDIGNTFTRVAAISGDRIRVRTSLPTASLTMESAAAVLKDMLNGERGQGTLHVASVVPAATLSLAAAAERAGISCHVIRSGKDAILPHRLTTPETTGVDRLLAALAAGQRGVAEAGYLIVQCGSAATVDAVDKKGIFRGGYILPGPGMWLSGMSAAAQLPNLSAEQPEWTAVQPGDNTRDAMLHGLHAALPAAVAASVGILAAQAGLAEDAPVTLTGGWGRAVLPLLVRPHRYDGDLLLHGIRIFAERRYGEEKTT